MQIVENEKSIQTKANIQQHKKVFFVDFVDICHAEQTSEMWYSVIIVL